MENAETQPRLSCSSLPTTASATAATLLLMLYASNVERDTKLFVYRISSLCICVSVKCGDVKENMGFSLLIHLLSTLTYSYLLFHPSTLKIRYTFIRLKVHVNIVLQVT